jgi:hypothetical protein
MSDAVGFTDPLHNPQLAAGGWDNRFRIRPPFASEWRRIFEQPIHRDNQVFSSPIRAPVRQLRLRRRRWLSRSRNGQL